MQIASHGGHCCGIKHLYGFASPREPNVVRESFLYRHPTNRALDCMTERNKTESRTCDEAFKGIVDTFKRERLHGYLEAVLTDGQCEGWDGHWPKELKDAGFVFVTRFYNNNSYRYCNLFHLYQREPTGQPPNWEK